MLLQILDNGSPLTVDREIVDIKGPTISDNSGRTLLDFSTFTQSLALAAGKSLTAASGAGAVDLSAMTGTFKTPTGAHTINGAVTLAANKGIAYTSGTGAADFSNGSGVFKTTTGAVTIGGDTTLTAGKSLNLGRATVAQLTNVNTDVTCNAASGVITTMTATTAAATSETGFTLNNSCITAASVVVCQIVAYSGTWATNGYPALQVAAPGSGTVVIKIANHHAANALNGTMKIHFIVA